MKKSQINQQLIESLGQSINDNFTDKVTDFVFDLVSAALSDISERTPFVNIDNCVLTPVNEAYSKAFSQLSEFDFFLGIDNPQIAFNSKSRKNILRFAWTEFKANFRLGKKKYKKKKKEKEVVPLAMEKYKLSDLKHDLMGALASYLRETSVVYEYQSHLSLVGKEDFGTNVKVNIYVCVYDAQTGVYKLFNEAKNSFFEADFGYRFDNFEQKKRACGGELFVQMLKIFNALYVKATNKVPNQILVESLVYNCPTKLFVEGDIYRTFVNVANYIRLANPKDITSICNAQKSIFDEPLICGNNSQMQFSRLINILDGFKF